MECFDVDFLRIHSRSFSLVDEPAPQESDLRTDNADIWFILAGPPVCSSIRVTLSLLAPPVCFVFQRGGRGFLCHARNQRPLSPLKLENSAPCRGRWEPSPQFPLINFDRKFVAGRVYGSCTVYREEGEGGDWFEFERGLIVSGEKNAVIGHV